MHRLVLSVFTAGAMVASGQTQVDLRAQGKNVDFSEAAFTRPFKTGVSLPATCGVGDLYFKSDASGGANLFGCIATDTWALESSTGSGTLTIQNSGSTVGGNSVLDFSSGFGLLYSVSDAGSKIVIQQSVDTAVIPSKATAQNGSLWLCPSASASTSAYTCAMSPTLTAYSTGMFVNWKPDVYGAGGATTLNVDTLGAIPVKQADGTSDPTAVDIAAGRLYRLWYDGTVFRILDRPSGAIASGVLPTCDVSFQGRLWLTPGAAGVKDDVQVCAKDATDAFAWRSIY